MLHWSCVTSSLMKGKSFSPVPAGGGLVFGRQLRCVLAKRAAVERTCAHETPPATGWDNGTAPPPCHCADLFRPRHQFDFRRLPHSHWCAVGRSAAFRSATLCHGRLV